MSELVDEKSHQSSLLLYLKKYIMNKIALLPVLYGKKILELKNLDLKNVYGLEVGECVLIYDSASILNNYTFKVTYKIDDFLPLHHNLKLYCYIEGKNLDEVLPRFIKHIAEKVYCRDCGKLRNSSEFLKEEDQCFHCVFETLVLYENKQPEFCSICQHKTPRYIKLHCGHVFHRRCVSKLLKNKCPLCNSDIEIIDI